MNACELVHDAFFAVIDGESTAKVARLTKALFDTPPHNGLSPLVQRHPLGFLALTWPLDDLQYLRVHYWSRDFKWAQSDELQIHDHTFEFDSAVVLGQIRNEIYSIYEHPAGSVLYSTRYVRGGSRLTAQRKRVATNLDSTHSYFPGSFYRMRAGVLHQTFLESENGLTVLAARYASKARDGARVIGRQMERSPSFQRAIADQQELSELVGLVRDALEVAVKQLT